MLERLSVSVDGARQKTAKAVGDRLNVFGTKKQVPFHIVISELRAELMSVKQHAPGQPCVLLWVRGDTVHVTEDSVGQTVLSWSDTYFAQVVPLQVSGSASGFRPKECKFKVQQRGKTIAKTAVIDLTKYCSEIGLARDQSVSVPLQPSGTLYFVISTAPASEQQQQQQQNEMLAAQSSSKNLMRASHNPSVGGVAAAAAAGTAATAAAAAAGALGLAEGTHSAESSRLQRQSTTLELGQSIASKYGGAVAGAAAAAASTLAAAVSPATGQGKGRAPTPETGPSPEDADRASTSGRGHQRKPSGGLGGVGAGWAAGLAAAAAAATGSHKSSPTTPSTHGSDAGAGIADDKSVGAGVFKRKAKGAAGGKPSTAFAAAGGAAAAAAAAAGVGGRKPLPPQLTLRKSDSDNVISAPGDGRISWDEQAERSLSQAMVGTHGKLPRGSGSGYAGAHRAIRSFTGTPPPRLGGGGGGAAASSPLQPLNLPQGALDAARNLARASGAASTCSDTAASAAAAAAAVSGGKGGAADGGWGSWFRWGRSSNQSAGTASGGASQTSLPPNGGGGSGAAAGEQESSNALEAAIRGTTEVAEVRELALDLLHERDGWRARALVAQDAAARAQVSRGSAVREAQRLEVRLRQYQDELGRRTDGSLLQELVEAKVRIAELANENMKLRRQITHMGPLFYDGSDDDTTPDARS